MAVLVPDPDAAAPRPTSSTTKELLSPSSTPKRKTHLAAALRELQFLAIESVDKIRRAGLAEQDMETAATKGAGAAAARLKTATKAVASLTLDLESRLEEMNKRITRSPHDAYHRVISVTSPSVILGTSTNLGAPQLPVQRILIHGITGFVDKADPRWEIGTY